MKNIIYIFKRFRDKNGVAQPLTTEKKCAVEHPVSTEFVYYSVIQDLKNGPWKYKNWVQEDLNRN